MKTFAQVSESGLISPTATPPLSKQLLRSKSIASSKDTLLIRFNPNLKIKTIVKRIGVTIEITLKKISLVLPRKNSKTLPRGFTIGPGSESSGDSVFGLYGDLMNVEEYEVNITSVWIISMMNIGQVESASTSNLEGSRKELRSSDPELETIPYRFHHPTIPKTFLKTSNIFSVEGPVFG